MECPVLTRSEEPALSELEGAWCPRFASVLCELTWEGNGAVFSVTPCGKLEWWKIESEWTAQDREASKTCLGSRIFLCPEPALSLSKG